MNTLAFPFTISRAFVWKKRTFALRLGLMQDAFPAYTAGPGFGSEWNVS